MKNILVAFFCFAATCSVRCQTPQADPHTQLLLDVVGTPTVPIGTIGILVYPGCNDLDVFGPRYVLGQYMGAKTLFVATQPGPIRTVMGVDIVPDTVLTRVDQLDILVVPGGAQGTVDIAKDTAVLAWIRRIDAKTHVTASVCTGAWVLGAAGLLEGKSVSTNWYRAQEAMAQFGARYTGQRFTHDGKYWTSAGVTAGMDMSLALLAQLWSLPYAQGVMLDMEYDPSPPFVGGTPEKTPPAVFQLMQTMYDMGLYDQLHRLKPPATTGK
ncbi:MAG: DJ-1/PfpI family protein [Bacteroidia bacterium]|nr:DJ-1/PfpI family protein [Bacteroidia bacterium]